MSEMTREQDGTIVNCRNVTLIRDSKPILQHIDWQVRPGEHWTIAGLNGSGKTTLLNMINGYIWPTYGTISVLGKPFGTVDLRQLRRSIGWVSSHLQEQLPGGETGLRIVLSGKFASHGLYEQPTEDDVARAYGIMDELGCRHVADRPYRTCSQGEKQRLLIARALMASPALLILDEPCNGLDLFAREQLLQSITRLGGQVNYRSGKQGNSTSPTLLYVTHYLEEIMPIFRHTLLLREGQVFFAGPTQEALQTERLQQFFGVSVEVTWRDGRPWIQIPGK